MRVFKPSITRLTVSSAARKMKTNQCGIITRTSSSKELGRVISYKNGTTRGEYKRI